MADRAVTTSGRPPQTDRLLAEAATRSLFAASARLLLLALPRKAEAGSGDPIEETFGSWKTLKTDGAKYVRNLRKEWESRERRLWGDE